MSLALRTIAMSAIVPLLGASTPPPNVSSGKLADREFAIRAGGKMAIARYFGSGSLDGSKDAQRALIIVHGVLRNADLYYQTGVLAVNKARAAHVLVIAPQFLEQRDLAGQAVSAQTLRWDDRWPGGSPALAPVPLSSYAVFDAMIARLSDRRRFPAMREIVIAGHSAGGQIVQRYAVVGRGPDLLAPSPVKLHLIVANPSSYFYFGSWRPVPQKNCPSFDRWRYGLRGAPAYVSGTEAALERRYVMRRVTYLLGTADTNRAEWDLDRTCAGEAQGAFRFVRGKNYIAYLKRRHPGGTSQDFGFVKGVPHDNRRMFTSLCGAAILFDRSPRYCAPYGKV
jgi:pimeloyl-ACP methyl ester carboxylesterase